jgi:[ribosomal protein S5]-alanine N-acetyltransferase
MRSVHRPHDGGPGGGRYTRLMGADGFWLTTERLGLRRFAAGDAEWLVELFADPEVTRYLGGTKTRAQTEELFRSRIVEYYDRHPGLGIWKTVERCTGRTLGFHLLNHIQGEPDIQVGFTLIREAWGRGFATEMGEALLRHGFRDLRLPRIAGIASLENHASQHVLRKIGLLRNGERAFAHQAYAAEGALAWFERDAAEWIAERGAC